MSNIHKHLLVDGLFINPPTQESILNDWLNRLVKAVDMELFLEPQSKFCHVPGNEGISGMAWLTTSHCSAHFWSEAEVPFGKLDLYSCRTFHVPVFLELLQEFKPIKVNYTLFDRTDEKHSVEESNVIYY